MVGYLIIFYDYEMLFQPIHIFCYFRFSDLSMPFFE